MGKPRRVTLLLLLLALSIRTAATEYTHAQPPHHDVVAQLQGHARSATHTVGPRLHAVAASIPLVLLRVSSVLEPGAALQVLPAQTFTSYTTTIPPPGQLA
jgi:hypothetical protein